MLSLEEALVKILEATRTLPSETVRLDDALGRFLAAPVVSEIALPPADNSAMDGYAVRSGDLKPATADSPVTLRITGHAPAGVLLDGRVEPGTCIRIFTGSVLPAGADAVVMQEDVVVDTGSPEIVGFPEKVAPWENIRFRGEDVKEGGTLVEAGEKLTEPRLSLLAAVGLAAVTTTRQPAVGFIATGNELQEAGKPLAPGAIYESNRIGLAALARQAGAIAKIYPIVRDDLAATREALERAFSECDVVVSTGGVSVGEMDWVKPAFEAIAGKLEFWKVAIRPGKPFAFGSWQGKFFFGLPGNPVSAMVTFTLLVRPALLKLQGAREAHPRPIRAALAEALNNPADRRHFMRVTLDAGGKARLAGAQSSHILSGLSRADGLVDVPPKTTLATGSIVAVVPWS